MKTFCPSCEKETNCVYIAELYECKECGCDFESKQRQMQERLAAANARAEAAEARIHSAEFWTNFVYPDGASPEEIQNELMDYHQYLDDTTKVYYHISGGKISKPNTMAFELISIYDDEITSLESRAEAAEARAERLQAALADIAHGPVGTWNEPQHAAEVIKHMMRVASDALKGGEE